MGQLSDIFLYEAFKAFKQAHSVFGTPCMCVRVCNVCLDTIYVT